jgi:hypothetical protein
MIDEVKVPEKTTMKARLIGTVIDIAISLLIVAILLGKVALPTFYAVVTSGFDEYTVLVWGVIPLITSLAILVAIFNRAKYAYSMGGTGGMG